MTDRLVPGEVDPGDGSVAINEGRETATVSVANTGDRPIQVGSHYHFFEANRALSFDRAAAYGMRLDIPAGTAVRFEPGDERTVDLVAYGGKQRVTGMNGLTNGATSDGDPGEALARARDRGFADTGADGDDPMPDGSATTGDETDEGAAESEEGGE